MHANDDTPEHLIHIVGNLTSRLEEEHLKESVIAKTYQLYLAYEGEAHEEPDLDTGCLLTNGLSVAALILHHVGGGKSGTPVEIVSQPADRHRVDSPHKLQEEMVQISARFIFSHPAALQELEAYAEKAFCECSRACLNTAASAPDAGRTTTVSSKHGQNVHQVRFCAHLIAGLWRYALVSFELYYRALSFTMGIGDGQAITKEQDCLLMLARENPSLPNARAAINIYLSRIVSTREGRAAFFCRCFNLSYALVDMVYVSMHHIAKIYPNLARLLPVMLSQVLRRFQEHHARNKSVSKRDRIMAISNIQMACSLTHNVRTLSQQEYTEAAFYETMFKVHNTCWLMWDLTTLVEEGSPRYNFSGITPRSQLPWLQKTAEELRNDSRASSGMTFPFETAQQDSARNMVEQLCNLADKHETPASSLSFRVDVPFMAEAILSILYVQRSCHVQEFAHKLHILFWAVWLGTRTSDLWRELCAQVSVALVDNYDAFESIHGSLLPNNQEVLKQAVMAASGDAKQRAMALEIDFAHRIFVDNCRLALLVGDGESVERGLVLPDLVRRQDTEKVKRDLEELRIWQHRAYCVAVKTLEKTFMVQCFEVPFLTCMDEWIIAICTNLSRPLHDCTSVARTEERMRAQKSLIKPYTHIVNHLLKYPATITCHAQLAICIASDKQLVAGLKMNTKQGGSAMHLYLATVCGETGANEAASSETFDERRLKADLVAAELLADEAASSSSAAESKRARKRANKLAAAREAEARECDDAAHEKVNQEALAATKLQARWRGRTSRRHAPQQGVCVGIDGNRQPATFFQGHAFLKSSLTIAVERAAAALAEQRQRARDEQRQRARDEAARAKRAKKERRRARAVADQVRAERETDAAEALRAEGEARRAARERQAAHEKEEAEAHEREVAAREREAAAHAREAAAHARADAELQRQLEAVMQESAREQELLEAEERELRGAIEASKPASPLAPEPPPEPKSQETECVVCLEDEATHIAVPCGHLCLCSGCTKGLALCPICRTPLSQTMRVFRS